MQIVSQFINHAPQLWVHVVDCGGLMATTNYHLTPLSQNRPINTSASTTSYSVLVKKNVKFLPKIKTNLVMARHIPPHEKADKQGEMPLHILSPIPSLNCCTLTSPQTCREC